MKKKAIVASVFGALAIGIVAAVYYVYKVYIEDPNFDYTEWDEDEEDFDDVETEG